MASSFQYAEEMGHFYAEILTEKFNLIWEPPCKCNFLPERLTESQNSLGWRGPLRII